MRLEVDNKTFWWDVIYKWNNNKARKKRRKAIQKAKRANRRKVKIQLNKLNNPEI